MILGQLGSSGMLRSWRLPRRRDRKHPAAATCDDQDRCRLLLLLAGSDPRRTADPDDSIGERPSENAVVGRIGGREWGEMMAVAGEES
jgi:hypothetical protein